MTSTRHNAFPSGIAQLPGYIIQEQLYGGTRTLVYRGMREGDRLPVVIKFLRNEYPAFNELVQFRNQYTIAKNLDIPGIVKPYSLEQYRNSYALVMEDFGGISFADFLKTSISFSIPHFLVVALQLTEILDGLHRERVIHKDIKPANIPINPETHQVKLIDFSISSLLPKETQEIQNPNVLEGTLAYISPEQTGRMNRGIDYRTDFYSLGVTFYELLAGQLPFESDDPMELVHCHIAKIPPSVCDLNPDVPPVLANLVMKLMAKNAEDRYQSALGLKHDLETCLYQFKETGKIEAFEIGTQDLCDRFIIPEKLYGREKEVKTLLEAFERASNGTSELMLVAGFSGIGKTAAINEVHKPIVRQRGYFVKGKFDQFNRNIPFSAFVQAFRDLIGQLLSESDAQLQTWKAKILSAIGDNGQVLINVIPELEKIVGTQPAAQELSGSAAQNRFNLLMQKFVQVFTSVEHPLVIFLDDLQWADSASLKLLELLMHDTGHLLMLGAYRDNEVFPAHPFVLTANELVKTGATVNKIVLQPLSLADTNQLVADTLNCNEHLAQPLTDLIYQKTQGNPFFTTQFLKALHDDKLIEFNWHIRHWQCDLARVKALAITDDVVEFMALQLQKLPTETQEILKLAACIGGQFDLNTLAIVSEKLPEATATLLWKALQEGLIVPIAEVYKFFTQSDAAAIAQPDANATYKFLHDRVQQAAYSLIPESERAIAHYQIGQLLLQQISPEAREERIFQLVNQLNYGTTRVVEQQERDNLAQLNLIACRKARTATAYQAAREYAKVGVQLLGTDAWQRQYEMTLALHELAVEVASLVGDFEQMNQCIDEAIYHAKTPLDRVQIYQIKIQSLTSRNEFLEAIATGQSVLQLLGINLPDSTTIEDVRQIKQEIDALMSARPIEGLIHLPKMTDAQQLAIVQIAASITPACYMTGSMLYFLIVALQVKLSIQFGNSPVSAYSYAGYAFQLRTLWQEMTGVQSFGQLAYHLASEPEVKNIRPTTFLLLGGFVLHWTNPLPETLPILQEGYQAGLETGNLDVGYDAQFFCLNSYWCGQPLTELEPQLFAYYQQLRDLNQVTTANCCLIYRQATLILLGQSENDIPLRQDSYEEKIVLEAKASNDFFRLCQFYLYRFTLSFLLQDFAQAEKDAVQTRQYLAGCMGSIVEPILYFYDSLTVLAQLSESTAESDEQWQRLQENQAKLEKWAHHAPINHLHKYHLVEAEKSRFLKQTTAAIEFYDLAIQGAKENEYLHEEALANELAAKFYLNWGKEKVAAGYIQEAYYCYAKWGAKAKTDDLEKCYPHLLQPILQQRRLNLNPLETIAAIARPSASTHTSGTSSSSISEALDFASILKAAQAISSSLEIDELMASLTRILLENSGAKKVALILYQDGILQVRAIARVEYQENTKGNIETILDSQSLDTCSNLPKPLIHYVKNTRQVQIVDRLQTEIPGLLGEYLLTHQPHSVCCLPILNRNHLVGVLYLENQLTSGVFTRDRIEILNLLCSQAAISLENARLYALEQERARELAQKEEQYRSIFESVNDGLSICDLATGQIIEVNPTLCEIYGYSQEEWLYLTPLDFMHPDYLRLFDSFLETLNAGKEFYTRSLCKRKDGRFFDVEVKAVPFMYKGKLHGLSIVRDISDRKLAEDALIESEAYHRNLFEQSSIGLLLCRMDGSMVYANAAFARIVGRTSEEVLSLTYWQLTPEKYADAEQQQLHRLQTTGCYGPYEKEYIHNNGSLVPVRLSGVIVERHGEQFIWSSIEDISDRKAAEATILQKSQELERALQDLQNAQLQLVQNEKMSALGNLVAGVAHEINNPVGCIVGNVNATQDYINALLGLIDLYGEEIPQPSAKIEEELEAIDLEYVREDLPKLIKAMKDGGSRITAISKSLRTFSRADSDAKQLFNLHEGIDSTVLILRHRLKANEHRPAIEVITEYGNLPEIACFPGQLNQVFMNILANAIDALDESNSGRSFAEIKANPNRITIRTMVEDERVKIAIADNGKGMTEAVKARIFDHLFTTKGVGKGTGLGLAIARQIVEQNHGGTLACTSTWGDGTEFTISLPLR